MTTPDAAASPKPHALTRLEIGAILAIIVVWGVNNAAGKLATESLPPLLVGVDLASGEQTARAAGEGGDAQG